MVWLLLEADIYQIIKRWDHVNWALIFFIGLLIQLTIAILKSVRLIRIFTDIGIKASTLWLSLPFGGRVARQLRLAD